MGFLDKFLKREQAIEPVKNQAPSAGGGDVAALTLHSVQADRDVDLKSYRRFPFAELAAVGTEFAQIATSLRTIQQQVDMPLDGIYRVCETGKGIFKTADITGVLRGEKGRFKMPVQLEKVDQISATQNITLPYNPSMLIMAAALCEINQRFDEIEAIGREILEFLEQDKEAQIRGSLAYLQGILKDYGHNCGSEVYMRSQLVKVLDIKKDALDKLEFYRGRLERRREKQLGPLHVAQNVEERRKALRKELQNLRLSLHIYAFARFLEVLLLENFNADFIGEVAGDIEQRSRAYDALYEECLAEIEGKARTAVGNQVIGGAGHAIRFMGEVIAKVPVVSNSQIDESLIAAGGGLLDRREKRSQRVARKLDEVQDSTVRPFVGNLHTLEALYNHSQDILFDRDNFYIKCADAMPTVAI